jgi:thiamine-phosphate pyrophosphorylase
MYTTSSHPSATLLAMDTLRTIVRLGLPVIAIGGVTPDRSAALRRAGVHGVAAIRALWDAPNPGEAARAMLAALEPA